MSFKYAFYGLESWIAESSVGLAEHANRTAARERELVGKTT